METAEMRRSTLQRKDREELTLIATTLGRKPPSRARKGEIIDLILDLAAGGDGSEFGGQPTVAEAAETESTPEAAESSAEAADDDMPDVDTADEGSPEEDASDGDRPKNREPKNREPKDREPKDREPKDREPKDREDEGPDSGNRKRRRRGRDRETNKDSNEGWDGEPIPVAGYLELRPEGYGFLRVDGALPSKDDAYVPVKMVRQFALRKGDHLAGTSRPANRNEKNPAMTEVQSVNGGAPDSVVDRPGFDSFVAVYPSEQVVLAGTQEPSDPTARAIDLLTPVGRGQRALLAGPPRSGKTTILQHVIRSIETNHEDLDLLVLLLDERPEDITEMNRWVDRGEVIASSFDRPADEQVAIAEMVIERAKRLAESGRDVVVVVDGLTRLARAYAQDAGGGRSGVVVDATAVHPAKRFLGAARNLEDGGSLTLFGTITVGTDSVIDSTIYEELAPTANLELRLVRAAVVRRLFPAIDIGASATVHPEKLVDAKVLAASDDLRRELATVADGSGADAGAELLALLDKIAAE